MLSVRPVNFADIQDLERLAVISGGRLTTLPANRDHLSELIGGTQQSLRKAVRRAEGESYHFVLEQDGQVIGVAGIESAVGLGAPFYSYRIDEVVHASSDLQIHNRIPALHLCQDYTGCSRLYTLFIDGEHRTPESLHLLSRARMLFMAQFPERFAARTLVELQGSIDDNGNSPFWDCLGRHFFSMEFDRANYLTGINAKSFIADLMPHYPVYVPLLTPAAQACLGEPRPDVEEVMALLEDEGFNYRGYVDIFDAGPTLEHRTNQIRSVEQSRELKANIGRVPADAPWMLVSNGRLEDYRCLLTRVVAETTTLSADDAERLGITDGEPVRTIPVAAEDIGRA
ncbi:arginine N-succinyltransferase [Motiliproteus sediminis]|uniref:arginine N-succinyltransferase n=1 Tax=Motiliproteus sediminis TaxID=1468178 RepID=UPI001AEF79DC|nr:arginine N-succinyltransferase [Motiliproteus sediminis]